MIRRRHRLLSLCVFRVTFCDGVASFAGARFPSSIVSLPRARSLPPSVCVCLTLSLSLVHLSSLLMTSHPVPTLTDPVKAYSSTSPSGKFIAETKP